jgi:peptidoglycan/LPS O-acetylase OafA/YrhL
MKEKILSIHYMRAIAIIIVVCLHYSFYLGKFGMSFFYPGRAGVDLFFLISGFIIVYITGVNKNSIPSFLLKRFIRIYPAFIIVWFIACIFLYRDLSYKSILQSLLLFHLDYNGKSAPGFGFNLIGPPWTLTYEFYFYFLFSIGMLLSYKYRVMMTSIIIILSAIILQFVFNGKFSFDSTVSANFIVSRWWQVPAKILSSTILFEFIVGMVCAEIFNTIRSEKLNKSSRYILFLCYLISFSLFCFGSSRNMGMLGFFWYAFPLFIGMLIFDKFIGFSNNKFLYFLGDVSCSLYITHWTVFLLARLIFTSLLSNDYGIVKFSLLTLTSITMAYSLHIFVEIPCINLIRRKKISQEVLI